MINIVIGSLNSNSFFNIRIKFIYYFSELLFEYFQYFDTNNKEKFMASNHSFDIVSEIDFQEVDNALNQAAKEIQQRYDLKDSNTEIILNKKEKLITLNTKDDYSRKQSIDILQTKFIKRGISIKALKYLEPEPAASGRLKQVINLQSGISKENAKLITKMIKESRLKVNTQIQDEQIRVQAPKIDDLQAIMKLVKEADLDFPVQFTNYK